MTTLPAASSDCHVHLFGPAMRYPFAPDRVYTPGDADEDALIALHARLGLSRVVLVQPSPYGSDNRRMLAGLEQLGSRARGIAVLDLGTPQAELERLHAKGVRGVRVNAATQGMDDPQDAWNLIESTGLRSAPGSATTWRARLRSTSQRSPAVPQVDGRSLILYPKLKRSAMPSETLCNGRQGCSGASRI